MIPDDLLKPPSEMSNEELGKVIGSQMDGPAAKWLAAQTPVIEKWKAERTCPQCGMTVSADPMKHWHDDYRADTSAHDDMVREAGEYQREERKNRL